MNTLDPEQEIAARKLGALAAKLHDRRGGVLRFLRRETSPLRGIYLWGNVGRGKTMLMDRFFEDVRIAAKRRLHFNDFMAEVHTQVHAARSRHHDPIPSVAGAIASESKLLCLDEFEVLDITDAMILGRLFEQLLSRGVVAVVTSNAPPHLLYEGGLNRQLFLPFIAFLERHVDIVRLEGNRDYRLGRIAETDVYLTPLGSRSDAMMDSAWSHLTDNAKPHREELRVFGHGVAIPRCARGVARFSFQELCESPLGAWDYLALARRYRILLLDGIPQFDEGTPDSARRFGVLVDTLYDEGVKLICSAATAPQNLFSDPDMRDRFRRAISRLFEMQSADYLHRGSAPCASAASPFESLGAE